MGGEEGTDHVLVVREGVQKGNLGKKGKLWPRTVMRTAGWGG